MMALVILLLSLLLPEETRAKTACPLPEGLAGEAPGAGSGNVPRPRRIDIRADSSDGRLKADDEQSPPPPMPSVSAFDTSFSAPSFDGPSKNMPVGNGELVANVWVDGVRNGSLALLLGRSDVFSGDVQPLKLGRLRVELEPNPFSSWFKTGVNEARTAFSQRLDLQRAMILITAGTVHIRVWSDIHGPDSVHVEIDSPEVKTSVTISIDSWRVEPTYIDCRNNARGPCESNLTLPADTFVDDSYYADPYYSLAWYRRNEHSVFASTLTEQKLGNLASRTPDPLMNRTSGAIVIANTDGMAFEHRNATHAVSPKSAERHSLTVFTNTMERVVPRPGQANAWAFLKQTMERAKASVDPDAALANHTAWWAAFWKRSWIVISAPSESESNETAVVARALSEAYTLNRYLMAIQSRGNLPMHHNGGTVTWGWNGSTHNDPDYRSWGGGYWFQNVRHSYWYTLLAGDTDLMRPLYQMYMKQLPVMRERSRQWYGHNGTRFAETSFFYGAFEPVDYGCHRKPTDPPDPVSPYIKNHIQGGVELATMLLHIYQHTGNATLLLEIVLPWCESLLEFYDEHFPKANDGQLFLQHAQSCETWPDCDNPAAQVAALMRIAEGLQSVPRKLLSTKQAAFFSRIAKSIPSIPLTNAQNGRPQISPCDGGFPSKHVNGENVETYVVWPYEYFAVNRSVGVEAKYPLAVGRNTFANVHFGHGNSAWRYDGQDAALLGMANYSWQFVRARVLDQGRCENSTFPGYLAKDPGDGAPQVESNGIVAVTLQKMLMQTDGARILLFPAFLKGIDVDFQLNVPGHGPAHPPALLRVVAVADEVTVWVAPSSRQKDVVLLAPQ